MSLTITWNLCPSAGVFLLTDTVCTDRHPSGFVDQRLAVGWRFVGSHAVGWRFVDSLAVGSRLLDSLSVYSLYSHVVDSLCSHDVDSLLVDSRFVDSLLVDSRLVHSPRFAAGDAVQQP